MYTAYALHNASRALDCFREENGNRGALSKLALHMQGSGMILGAVLDNG